MRSGVLTGIGDDCAILRLQPPSELLVTTDFTLEGVHFRREWHPPEVVGCRCLTRGLSDIAAMGGEPVAAFLSLALPRATPQPWVDRFFSGLLELANEFRITLAGGDTAQSPKGILADIVVVGTVPKGKAIRRSGTRDGDQIYVTGALGGSAAALSQLRKAGGKLSAAGFERHFRPMPRIAQGRLLRQRGLASAMIDLSDGLSTDLAHICEESRVGAEIEAAAIPLAAVGKSKRRVSLDQALHGGEDYELLFTSSTPIPAVLAGVPVTRIGRITRKAGLALVFENGDKEELKVRGWEHFHKNR